MIVVLADDPRFLCHDEHDRSVEVSSLEAYVLINTEANALWQVAEAALKIEGARTAHAVTGQFDAVVLVQFSKMDYLARIIERIQNLKGVLRTQTLITIPPPVRE
jgi:DNA-binding Lrp family transcriptional regulator